MVVRFASLHDSVYIYIYSPRNKNVHISILIKRKEVKGERQMTLKWQRKIRNMKFTHSKVHKEAQTLGLSYHSKANSVIWNPFWTKIKTCCWKQKQMKAALSRHLDLCFALASILYKIMIFFLFNSFVLYALLIVTDKRMFLSPLFPWFNIIPE